MICIVADYAVLLHYSIYDFQHRSGREWAYEGVRRAQDRHPWYCLLLLDDCRGQGSMAIIKYILGLFWSWGWDAVMSRTSKKSWRGYSKSEKRERRIIGNVWLRSSCTASDGLMKCVGNELWPMSLHFFYSLYSNEQNLSWTSRASEDLVEKKALSLWVTYLLAVRLNFGVSIRMADATAGLLQATCAVISTNPHIE